MNRLLAVLIFVVTVVFVAIAWLQSGGVAREKNAIGADSRGSRPPAIDRSAAAKFRRSVRTP